MIIALIASFIIVIITDLPELLKTNHRQKTVTVYSILIIIGFAISLIQLMDKIPTNPSEIIQRMVDFIFVR